VYEDDANIEDISRPSIGCKNNVPICVTLSEALQPVTFTNDSSQFMTLSIFTSERIISYKNIQIYRLFTLNLTRGHVSTLTGSSSGVLFVLRY
jgi:hypothetical protein